MVLSVVRGLCCSMLCPYLECGKVNDTVNIWVLLEDIVERFLISDVEVDKVWSLSGDELNAIDDF